MSSHDDDDIVDNALGSWMMTKQGLAQTSSGCEQVSRVAGLILMDDSIVFVILGAFDLGL